MKKFLKRLELQIQEGLHGTGYFSLIRIRPLLDYDVRARIVRSWLDQDEKKTPFLGAFGFGVSRIRVFRF